MRIGQNLDEARAAGDAWLCPVCLDLCNCSSPSCLRLRKGLIVTGQLNHEAKEGGWLSVAHYLVLTALDSGVDSGVSAATRCACRARCAPARHAHRSS